MVTACCSPFHIGTTTQCFTTKHRCCGRSHSRRNISFFLRFSISYFHFVLFSSFFLVRRRPSMRACVFVCDFIYFAENCKNGASSSVRRN